MSVVLGGAGGETVLGMRTPLRTASRAFALGKACLPTLALTAVAFAPALVFQELSIRAWGVVPLLGPWLLQIFAVYPAVAVARAVGLLLRNNGDRLGYGFDSDYLDPALPGVEPRGALP